jgi:abhydrolase domain-containing protein 6
VAAVNSLTSVIHGGRAGDAATRDELILNKLMPTNQSLGTPVSVGSTHGAGCFHLRPGPQVFQRKIVALLLEGWDLVLKRSVQPAAWMARLQRLSRWLCGMRTRYRKSGSFIWPYLEGGIGFPVVLLHGYGADKDRFGSLVPFLRGRHRVIIPDIPGFGEHLPDWSLSYGIDDQVERLDGFVRAIGLHRFHLMGLSLGGYLAGVYAAHFPKRVCTLALMDSAGFTSPVPSDAQRLFESTGQNIFFYTNEREVQALIDFLLFHPIKLPMALQSYWTRQGLARQAWRARLFDDFLAGGIDKLDRLAPSIQAPTLVIWGADDRICHVSAVDRILSLIPNCRAYIIHGCGHIPMVEYPVLFRRLYLNFLRGS